MIRSIFDIWGNSLIPGKGDLYLIFHLINIKIPCIIQDISQLYKIIYIFYLIKIFYKNNVSDFSHFYSFFENKEILKDRCNITQLNGIMWVTCKLKEIRIYFVSNNIFHIFLIYLIELYRISNEHTIIFIYMIKRKYVLAILLYLSYISAEWWKEKVMSFLSSLFMWLFLIWIKKLKIYLFCYQRLITT